jgi:hypothetical protein
MGNHYGSSITVGKHVRTAGRLQFFVAMKALGCISEYMLLGHMFKGQLVGEVMGLKFAWEHSCCLPASGSGPLKTMGKVL